MNTTQETATTFDLWQALVASPTKMAKRMRAGTFWYVIRGNIPSADVVFQVACQTAEGWQSWQVSTIVEVGVLLTSLWQLGYGSSETIWPSWTSVVQPLPEVVGMITAQSAGLMEASAAPEA